MNMLVKVSAVYRAHPDNPDLLVHQESQEKGDPLVPLVLPVFPEMMDLLGLKDNKVILNIHVKFTFLVARL